MANRAEGNGGTNPEVHEKPVRRQFDAARKMRILEEADRCTEPGQLGDHSGIGLVTPAMLHYGPGPFDQ